MIDGTVFVRYIHGLPRSTQGITIPNPDATFSVYINADLSEELQKEIYDHEMYHIEHDDLYNLDSVKMNELAANRNPVAASSVPPNPPTRRPIADKPKKPKEKAKLPERPKMSPSELWAYNQKMLLELENKWLYDVG